MPHDRLNPEQERIVALAEFLVRRSVREALQPIRDQLDALDRRSMSVAAAVEHVYNEER